MAPVNDADGVMRKPFRVGLPESNEPERDNGDETPKPLRVDFGDFVFTRGGPPILCP